MGTAVCIFMRGPRTRWKRWSVQVIVSAVLLALSVACGSGSSAHSGATIESEARAYTEAFLHGTVNDFTAAISTTCSVGPRNNAALDQLRNLYQTRANISFKNVHITSIETRNVTATTGQAWVHVDVPPELEGNDNWVSYAVEGGRWKLADCGRLPFGYNGSSGASTPPSTVGTK